MKYAIRSLIAICLLTLTSLSTQASVDLGEEHFIVFYHQDALGSPAAVSDHNGNVLWHEHNAPYGETRPRLLPGGQVLPKDEDFSGERLGYTGHELDRDTDLVYMKARFYDPLIGRFYSNDPVGFVTNSPMMFNRYAYANNNPYKYIDPTGMMGDDNNDPFGDATLLRDSQANAASTVGEGMSDVGDLIEPTIWDLIGFGAIARSLKGKKLLDKAGTDAAEAVPNNAADRAAEIHKAVPQTTQDKTTIAVTETAEGVRVVSSSERRLRPAQRRLLRENEVEGVGAGHAEVTGVNHARGTGLNPTGTAASRPICSNCQDFLGQEGIEPLSPLK